MRSARPANGRQVLRKSRSRHPAFISPLPLRRVAGIVLNFLHIDPIKALFWAAVLNGILAAPLMAVIMHMASSKRVMDRFTLPTYLKVIGRRATAIMFA